MAEDSVHISPYGVIEGRQTYLDLVAANEEAFYSPEVEIIDILEEPDRCVVRYRVDGTPATDWIYARDGEIVSIYSYYHVGPAPTF